MKILLKIALPVFLLHGCIKNNPEPCWIEVKEWTLNENIDLGATEGELSHHFSDAWVYINGKMIGVFEVPFKVPVLERGTCQIKLFPTIRNNGIAATKKMYPFVEPFELTAELTPTKIITIKPTTQYVSSTKFWIENFEDAAVKINTDASSSTILSVADDALIKKWNRYGIVKLNTTTTSWYAYTSQELDLPKGKEVYLELDYYNSNALVAGVLALSNNSVPKNNILVQLNAQSPENIKWKKMYIDLRETIAFSAGSNSFLISFQAMLDEGDSEGFIILDNIKVVYL
jgi:hypothetical protein